MADPRVKQIKIKTGVVKRLTKEKGYYEKEVVREQERQKKLESEGADEHVIKKQGEVIRDTEQMIPDTVRRLTTAAEDLKNSLAAEADLAETEEYKDASAVLKEAEEILAQKN